MAENRPSGGQPPHTSGGSPSAASSLEKTGPSLGPSVARVAPAVSLVEWHDREKQEQIDRLLEMLEDLRKDVLAGRISTLAVAGVADGKEFCQWEGKDPTVLYVLELAKAELLHSVRFGDADDDEDEDDEGE